MKWELIIAVIIAVPIILFPAAYVWYTNIGDVFHSLRKAKAKDHVRRNAE
jgi:hypothetical protein